MPLSTERSTTVRSRRMQSPGSFSSERPGQGSDDDNTVDTAWFEQVMALARQGEVTPEQIQALKRMVPYALRPLTRRLHSA